MSSTMLKTLAVILIVAAVILGLVAYGLSRGGHSQQAQQQSAPQPGEDQVLAVVAAKRIPPYKKITQDEVALVPISIQPAQYYTDTTAVVGRTPLRAIPMGSPLTDTSFGSRNTLAQAVPQGTQAMSLKVSDVIGVGGFVKPGDVVDVLVYLRKTGTEVKNTQARILLKSARVLSYEDRLINAQAAAGSNGQANNRDRRHERTAVLAVPDKDTTRVMLGASLGKLRLALHRGQSAEKNNANSDTARDSERQPPVLASGASETTPANATDNNASQTKNSSKKKHGSKKDKVITLSELAAVKKKKQKKTARRAPPRAHIEVYQGGKRSRISRPY